MSIIHQCSVISVVEKHLVAALPRCDLCGKKSSAGFALKKFRRRQRRRE
jgi:hypothetical protein